MTDAKTSDTKAGAPSIYKGLEALPADIVLGIAVAHRVDPHPQKVNLGIGAYRTEDGSAHVFDVVRKIEKEMADDPTVNKEYLGEEGIRELAPLVQKLVFGEAQARICSVQSLSGTGSLYLLATFLKMRVTKPEAKVYVSSPTWPNHHGIFTLAGFEMVEYPYWNNSQLCLDFAGLVQTFQDAPEGSVVVLHACAHNPTGVDPTHDQWQKIVEVMKNKKHIAVLDNAYQGFASGDTDRDAYIARLMEKSDIEFFVAQSFAKNMGLYGERMGMLHAVCADQDRAAVVMTHLKRTARRIYSNPPINGGRIVHRILSNPEYEKIWKMELAEVSGRINDIRNELRDGLVKKQTPGTWNHISKQIGMFSFTGLNPAQCERMISHWHIYMMKNGRISLAGLNKSNVQRVIDAIDDCVREIPSPSVVTST